ncbi:hypothetical protein DFH09DRAFT_1409515 [Mycena vulgaris]|nr:hypothetical protein DFH09DRAFT_1409515 [Mycena vulgaris]
MPAADSELSNCSGLLTVGPNFKLISQITADLEVGLELALNLAYKLQDRVIFPASGHTPQTPQPASSIVSRSTTNASIISNIEITANIIPTLSLAIEALGGVAGASIFFKLAGNLSMGLQSSGGPAGSCLDIEAGFWINVGSETHQGSWR